LVDHHRHILESYLQTILIIAAINTHICSAEISHIKPGFQPFKTIF